MRLLRPIRENPLIVLGVAVVVLIAWIAIDLSKGPLAPAHTSLWQTDFVELALPLPPQALMLPAPGAAPVSVAVLPKLRPGMTRAEVEDLLGPPTADRVEPVTIQNGRLRYRTTYELDDPGVPMTVRPIQFRARILPSPHAPRSLVALEFDASQPGHPLIEVLDPDPLF